MVSAWMTCALLLTGCTPDASSDPARAEPLPTASPTGPRPTASQPPGSPPATPTSTATTSPPPAACAIPARFAGQDLERLPLAAKKIALTFDAGANAAGVDPILRTLSRQRVKATFFLTGAFVRAFPGRARRIAELHLVGNHTDTHPDLTTLSDDEIRVEVRRAQETIVRETGQDPRRFFRFPFGARDVRAIRIVNRRCYVAFRWTVDTLGWKGTSSGVTVASVVRRVVDAARPGAIVLMHVGANPQDASTLDADALPTVIRELRAAGYHLVPLSAVMSQLP